MSEQTDQSLSKQESTEGSVFNRKLPRRRFLAGVAVGLAAAPLATAQFERAILDSFAKALMIPGTTDTLINTAKSVSEIGKSNENPNARPMHELIKSAIANSDGKFDKKVHYQRSPDYRDKEYYGKVFSQLTPTVLPKKPDDILEAFKKSIPGDASLAYMSSDSRITTFPEVYVSGSGLYERFKLKHPELFKTGSTVLSVEALKVMETEGKQDMDDARNFVESKRAESGKPISSSSILEYYLERNNGDLAASINDTSIFLKFMARSDPQTARHPSNASYNQVWFRNNLLDEYHGSSYQTPPSNESLENLIGKPYHSWNLVAMMQFFPVEVIQVAGVYRQLNTLDTQGISKTKADLNTLQDLRLTEEVCLKGKI